MGDAPEPTNSGNRPSELDLVVQEVVSEAHVKASELRPEEREYLKEHALKKPMGVLHIWALGVGVVITGEYFGWNQGLKEGGPIGMLLASLFVCALYMMWVLALSELSVAMPFAGGPLAYGRRAVGPAFGFIGRAALEQDLRRAFQLRLGIEALSHLEPLAAAECVDRRLTIGAAVPRRRATLARRHDAGIGQADHCVGRILGGVASLTAQLVECLLRTLHVRSELGGPLVQPTAERFHQVRLRRQRRQHQWRQRKGACGVRTLGGRWSLIRGLSLLRERGQGQEQRAATDHRVSHGRRSWHSNYSRTAGHHAPIDVAADRSLHRGRGENEEQRNF